MPHYPTSSTTSHRPPSFPSTHHRNSDSEWYPHPPPIVNSVTGVPPPPLPPFSLPNQAIGNNLTGSSQPLTSHLNSDEDIRDLPRLTCNTSSDSDSPALHRRPIRAAMDPIHSDTTAAILISLPDCLLTQSIVDTPQAPDPPRPPPLPPVPPHLLDCGAPCRPPPTNHSLLLGLPAINYLSNQHYPLLATPLPDSLIPFLATRAKSTSSRLCPLSSPVRAHHHHAHVRRRAAPRAIPPHSTPLGTVVCTRETAPLTIDHCPSPTLPIHHLSGRSGSLPYCTPQLLLPLIASDPAPLPVLENSLITMGSRRTVPLATLTTPIVVRATMRPVQCSQRSLLPSRPSSCCRNGFYDGSSSDDETSFSRPLRRSHSVRFPVHPPSPPLQLHPLSCPTTPLHHYSNTAPTSSTQPLVLPCHPVHPPPLHPPPTFVSLVSAPRRRRSCDIDRWKPLSLTSGILSRCYPPPLPLRSSVLAISSPPIPKPPSIDSPPLSRLRSPTPAPLLSSSTPTHPASLSPYPVHSIYLMHLYFPRAVPAMRYCGFVVALQLLGLPLALIHMCPHIACLLLVHPPSSPPHLALTTLASI